MRLTAKLVFQSFLLLSLLWSGTGGVVQAGTNVWTSNGPEGEGGEIVVALAVDPSNTNTVYAATYRGVFKSTDGGGSWGAIDFGMPNTLGRAFAVDPSNTDTIYAGVGHGVLKSTNGGESWRTFNNGLTDELGVEALAIDPFDTNIVYAGTWPNCWGKCVGGGVFKSTNGGASWSAMNNGLTYPEDKIISAFAIDPSNTSVIYAGTYFANGIFKSTNGGGSWSAINNGLTGRGAGAIAIDPSNTQTLYAADGLGVCKTTDGGGTWGAVNTGLAQIGDVRALAIDPKDTNTIYAGADYHGVFKSTDGGGSWSAFNTGLINLRVFAFAIDPTSATLYAGTFGGGVFQQQFNGGAPPNPEITSADFDGGKKITIWGSDFKNSPRVMINGMDCTESVRSASDTKIKIKGKPSALGLTLGDNTIRVIDSTGATSNVVILRL